MSGWCELMIGAVQMAVMRYTRHMFLLRFLMLGLAVSIAATAFAAERVVMPPPQGDAPADTAHAAQSPVESAPDLNEALKPDDDGSVDVRSYTRKDGAVVTEYANGGRVFKIKVQPSSGPAYYLYRQADGTFQRAPRSGLHHVSPPTWILKEF